MSPTSLNGDCALLVLSCDKYKDVWPTFFQLFRRHWSDCPFPIYVGSNSVLCEEPDVQPICVGADQDWTTSTRRMIEQLPHRYVLLFLEDFLLRRRVVSGEILGLLDGLKHVDGAYLRLRPFPAPDCRLARFPAFGEIEPGAPYRAALQAALWNRDSLLGLLVDGESPWQFEILGSRRSDEHSRGFYCTWKPAIDYYAGVTMGQWVPHAVALCRRQGVDVNLSARPMMSPRDAARRNMGRVLHELTMLLPWRPREAMLRWFRATGLRRPQQVPTGTPPPTSGASGSSR